MSWTQEEIEKIFVDVKKRVLKDEEFRKKLIEDPNKAISELSGKEIPENFKIKVVEEDPNYNLTFLLPPLLKHELDEENLDKVAGGVGVLLILGACGMAINVGPCPGDFCGVEADTR